MARVGGLSHLRFMQNEVFLFIRIVSAVGFFVTLYIGWYLFKNFERLFGVDPTMPNETGSSRAYSKVQIFSVWAHLLFATAAFALLLH
jgi:hypothetical protein